METKLHIRHDTDLTLRGVRWLVTDQTFGYPLLSRSLQEVLRLIKRNILAAAATRHSGLVDCSSLFAHDASPNGKVALILEVVYHSDGGSDDTDLDE